MDPETDPSNPQSPEAAALRTLLFAEALSRARREHEAQHCLLRLRDHLHALRGHADPTSLSCAYRQFARYARHREDWSLVRETAQACLALEGVAPLADPARLDLVRACAEAAFAQGDLGQAEAFAVEVVARVGAVHGPGSQAHRAALDQLITVREHKSFGDGLRQPTRHTRHEDGRVVLETRPDPAADLVAAFHGVQTRAVAGSAPAMPRGDGGPPAWARPVVNFLACLFTVWAIALAGDAALSWGLRRIVPALGVGIDGSLVLGGLALVATFFAGQGAGLAVAGLQTPFVVRRRPEAGAAASGPVDDLRQDWRAWIAGTMPAVLALGGAGATGWTAGLGLPMVSALSVGLACGWLCWPLYRRGIDCRHVVRRLATGDHVLLLRRFGCGALFRLRPTSSRTLAIFDPSRSDYRAPWHLARLFVAAKVIDLVQIALPEAEWYDAVTSLAASASCVIYDLEGYDERPVDVLSGLMMETELFLWLHKPMAYTARRRQGWLPDWLPDPLLVLTDGRPVRQVHRQLDDVLSGRFDAETTRRLDLHRALVQAELDCLRELQARERASPGTVAFNPIAALLARDHPSPSLAWRRDRPAA